MNLVNGVLNLYCAGLGILFIIWGTVLKRDIRRSEPGEINRVLLIVATVMLLLNGTALCFFYQDERYDLLFRLLNALSFVAFYSLIWLYTYYMLAVLSIRKNRAAKLLLLCNGIACMIGLLLWSSNCISPYFYDLVVREITNPILYRIAIIPGALPVIFNIISVIRYVKKTNKKTDAALLIFLPSLPLISSLIGPVIPGLSLQYPLIMAGLVANHFYFDEVLERKLTQREQEVHEYHLRAILERVKPHYIYNVLTSIYYLCESDPSKAQQAVGLFSDYLRDALRNMDQLQRVHFFQELKLVENYVKLEQMRFGDRLTVRYDIQNSDFSVPPFTVQPLVENAVKHGMKGSSGIHIEIKSWMDNDSFCVMVQDDGPGFDPSQFDAKESFGLKNMQELLRLWNAGSLTVESKPGCGVKATLLFTPPPHEIFSSYQTKVRKQHIFF